MFGRLTEGAIEQKTKNKKINMQVSAFKIEKYSTYMGDAGTSSRGSLNGKVNDKK